MISVVITKHNDRYSGIEFNGHAEYADPGQDIVCAAVSVLVINTFNAIERFTDDAFRSDFDEENGYIVMNFTEEVSDRSTLLLDTMLLGLDEIQKQYGDEYLSLLYKEV